MRLNPVPVTKSETVTGLSDAALVIAKLPAKLPVELPVALGVKVMLRVAFWLPATVEGEVGWGRECRVTENWVAVETALATVTAAVSWLVAVAVNVLLAPTPTLPKLTAPLGVVVCFEAILMP